MPVAARSSASKPRHAARSAAARLPVTRFERAIFSARALIHSLTFGSIVRRGEHTAADDRDPNRVEEIVRDRFAKDASEARVRDDNRRGPSPGLRWVSQADRSHAW